MTSLFQKVLGEFEEITTLEPRLTSEYVSSLTDLCNFLENKPLRRKNERRRWLLAHINRKFRLNRVPIAAMYATAAKHGTTFNYHEKEKIQEAFDRSDNIAFIRVLREKGVDRSLDKALLAEFRPVSTDATIEAFASEVAAPSKLRKEKNGRPIGKNILMSALSSFVFSFAEEEILHSYFDNGYSSEKYEGSFWLQLRADRPDLYNRECAMVVIHMDSTVSVHFDNLESLRCWVMEMIRRSYSQLNNHGYLAIWMKPLKLKGKIVTWELAEYAKLFAEKFDEVDLQCGYFQHRRVTLDTVSHVPGLNSEKAQFDLANEGFTYKDCFVLSPVIDSEFGSEGLLLLFQKNRRDETLIPCPTCRSHNVRGNSYPTLGVRSWECGNLLCPERSKYNRGKRYSFKALLMQEAIARPENLIPADLVRCWARDVQVAKEPSEVIEMLIRFYSLHGDLLHFFGFGRKGSAHFFGRRVQWHDIDFSRQDGQSESISSFTNSAWFQRYVVGHEHLEVLAPGERSTHIGSFRLIHGDARVMLRLFDDNHFDGAVTSPPYYNAREYAQWPNIYCYLHDMFGVIKECHRVLKPGAFFLFNIFDYFDNERTITFSAMGDKRLVLSSMLTDLFHRAGFSLYGNIAWDKGEIEGKRAFNGGNFSPYYQSPFNCWEHILVFGKPERKAPARVDELSRLPSVLRARPVLKMIRGENLHGHTAPFPIEVPVLIARLVKPGAILLDPFGGSGTTARALCHEGTEVVCVERDPDYCDLAERMFKQFAASHAQMDLLSDH